MTARDVLRWIGLLTILEGLAFLVGGRQTARVFEKIVPRWYRPWIRPLTRVSPTVVRAIGAIEAIFGLQILAMAPPAPKPLQRLASAALEPASALWQATIAGQAERRFAEILSQYVPPGARVLDLGCDDGDNLARLLDADLPFGSYLGLDQSPDVLARARARFDGIPKVDFLRNDLLNEQLPPGEFDLILSTWALDRIDDPFALVVRALRQLRQGGHALLLFASPPRNRWASSIDRLARMVGRQLHPASIYHGLPAFAAEQEFADGLISLVILENPAPAPATVSAAPPERSAEF